MFEATSIVTLRLGLIDFFDNETIPLDIGKLSALEQLWLSHSNIIGPMPLVSLPNLKSLQLSNNYLNGTFPPELLYLSSIEEVKLSFNDMLVGYLPTIISSSITTLEMSSMSHTGTIPTSIGDLSNLTKLDLSNGKNGHFEGTIPTEIGNLSNLRLLQLNDQNLIGTIPDLTGNSLITFNVGNNRLTGNISDIGNDEGCHIFGPLW